MKKGFTLIELLAVIVILAIIALIATPIVLSIIDDSKESSMIRSAEGYLRAVEYEVARAYVTANRITEGTYNVLSGGDICIDGYENNTCNGNILEIEYNNEGPISGSITFEDTKIVHYTLTYPSGITVVDGKVDDGEAIIQLAPGLYDENDNLLISWEDLTSMEYRTLVAEDECMWEGDIISCEDPRFGFSGTSSGAILNVNENGLLYSVGAYHLDEGSEWLISNESALYLEGKLVLDDSVKSIGMDTFSGCTGLTSIVIPESVTSIGESAFSGSGLTSITIPNSVTSIGSDAFSGCTGLTSITIPNSVTYIDSHTFSGSGLTSITIPNSVTSIEYSAFSGCTSLISVTIPSSVTSIGNNAFGGCTNLSNITIDENNTVYDSRDSANAIIETSTNTLIQGCKNTTIPRSVTSIASKAFSGTGLISITIPNNITTIGFSVFSECKELTSITIPSSVTKIDSQAFSGCTGLRTINYTGTSEQWTSITKGNRWNADTPADMVINYNYKG